MRYLGLDVGTKTVGVSITDRTNVIVSPLEVIKFSDIAIAKNRVLEIIEEYKITDLVIGLPKNMDGTLGFASNRSIEFKNMLGDLSDVDIFFADERLTTVEAEKILIDRDYRRDKRKKIIDSVAAVLILESFIKTKGENNGR